MTRGADATAERLSWGPDDLEIVSARVVPDRPAAGRSQARAVTPAGVQGAHRLKEYWTKGEGLAKWAESPHPWTSLYHHLVEFMSPEKAKRTAAEWFHDVFHFWPGSDKNRVLHGKPPRGDKIGPG